MGGLLSYFWGYSTVPDPATGLSPQDKYLINYSWGMAKKNAKETGFYLFQLLFKKYPEVRDMFPFAKGKEWSQLTSDPRLAAHVNSVLYALTSFVDHMDDVEVLDAMLRKTADNHVRRKVSIKEFELLGPLILQALTDKLGPRVMTPEATEAWKKLYGVILKIMGNQMSNKNTIE